MDRTYICIDLKSYYASVECVHRGLDPLKANLLVADESRSDQTICLAVSPSLKAKGVPGRPRLFEAKQKIREYEAKTRTMVDCIIAVPRMAEYERISAQIYTALPSRLSVPPVTRSPAHFETGSLSPVRSDSSTRQPPSIITPSAGTRSPGRSTTVSPETIS